MSGSTAHPTPVIDPDIVHLVLDDPARRNPVTPAFVADLRAALDAEVDAVTITAAPSHVFSAGGDLSLGDDALRAMSDDLYALYERISTAATVVLVAADGLAVGAGAQLVLAADLRFVGPRFAIRCADAATGLAAGMWALPAEVGRGRALDLLLTSRTLVADEAVRWGLADRLVDDPAAQALAYAAEVARIPRSLRSRIKRTVAEATIRPEAIRREAAEFEPPTRPGGDHAG